MKLCSYKQRGCKILFAAYMTDEGLIARNIRTATDKNIPMGEVQ